MPDNNPSTDDEVFNEAYSIISDDRRPLETRIDEVLNEIDGTNISAREVLIAYGAHLRENDPLDSNNRRVSTLITTADRYGIDITLEEIIDAGIEGDTGPKVATSVSSTGDDDDGININDRSENRTDENDTTSITFDIDFEDPDAVKNAAVDVYSNDNLSLQEKREHLKGLLQQARDSGVAVDPSDVRAAINEHRADSEADDTDDDLEPSKVTPGTDDPSPEPKPDEAKLKLRDASVSSTGIHAGESVRVTVTVENTGDSVGVKDIRISKNHEVVKKDTVTVEPGESETETFEVLFDAGGQHLLQVNDEQPVSITVLEPAQLTVTNISTDDTRVAPDESIPITATIENTGDLDGTAELDLVVGEHLFESREVTVSGNSTHEEQFEIELDQPGTYAVNIGDQEIELTALKPASVNVTDYRLSSTGLELGEELTVNVDVENTGDLDGTIAVALYSDGSTIETRSVEVEGQDTRTITFTTDFDRTGSHSVSINNLEPTDVTVLKPASATIRDFEVSDTSLEPEDTLELQATLDNTGDLSETLTLNLSANGTVIHTEDVEVPGNKTQEITISPDGDIPLDFSEFLDEPGEHSVSINGMAAETVEVLEPANVNVSYYRLSDNDVVPGENFEISVEIENTGDVAGETEIEIYIDNELIETRTVEVDGNSDKRGTFDHSLSDPGTYHVTVNDLEPTELEVRGTGEFNVTDVAIEDDTTDLSVGDEITIAATAENTTSLNSEQALTVYLGGLEVANEVFNLPGDTEDTFTITTPVEQPGIYDLEVDDTFVDTLEVTAEVPVVDLTNTDYITVVNRCIKKTDDGKRCTRDIDDDSVLCWQHEESLEDIDPENVESCQYTYSDGELCEKDAEDGGILCSEHNPTDETYEPTTVEDAPGETPDTDDESAVDWGEPLDDYDTGRQEDTTTDTDTSSAATEDATEPETTADADPDPEPTEAAGSDTSSDPVDTDAEAQTESPDDGHTREVSGPDNTTGTFNQNTNTRKTVSFDFVLDEDEDILPSSVDGAGMIIDNDEYIGIAEVQPRSWSIHTPEEKQQIINQYRSMFLGSLDFPVQIVCYPTEFDISEHLSALEDRTSAENVRDDESYLLNVGRQLYPNWLREYISRSQTKQRNFYIIVRVKPEQLNRFRQSNDGVLDTVEQRAPAIANALRAIIPGAGDDDASKDVTRKDCLMELHDRLQRLESALNPMGVNVEPITSRDEAMTVLYQYYNNEHPIVDNFDVATRSEFAPTMRIDEGDWPTDAMTDIHYEEYVSSGDNQ